MYDDTLKIDLDIKLPHQLFNKWLITRLKMLEYLGYAVIDVKFCETKKGYHFWFKINKMLSAKQRCELQFLLGDDIKRCKFNMIRQKVGVFDEFNALFSEKLRGVQFGK